MGRKMITVVRAIEELKVVNILSLNTASGPKQTGFDSCSTIVQSTAAVGMPVSGNKSEEVRVVSR